MRLERFAARSTLDSLIVELQVLQPARRDAIKEDEVNLSLKGIFPQTDNVRALESLLCRETATCWQGWETASANCVHDGVHFGLVPARVSVAELEMKAWAV